MSELGIPSPPTDRSPTAREVARSTLRGAIVSGQLSGGTRLIQSELAQRLKLSTTPVREALFDLAAEGLVEIEPYRGAVVHQLDADGLREIYMMKQRLEPLVMELAIANMTDEQLAAAAKLQAEMEQERDPTNWATINRGFHNIFIDSCGWPLLGAVVRSLYERAAPYVNLTMRFRPELMTSGNEDHRLIVEACARRDAEALAELVVAHMDITKETMEPKLDTGSQ